MEVRERARRAYERAQIRIGIETAAPLIVLVPLAMVLHQGGMPSSVAPIAFALAAILFASGWRGDGWRRAAPIGLLAGLPGLVIPRLVLAPLGHCPACDPMMIDAATCFLVCGGAGMVAGITIGVLAARDASPVRFAIGAAAIACLTAALTCVVAGMAGIAGVAAGVAVSTAPAVMLGARARASL
ncbi:MAG TPA: hypothetical protein VL463_31380 [Kofleriaceae bacterium]|jgi:hypothetical protein|nr:hypothetical protein [Kofleriaceae bacterium]